MSTSPSPVAAGQGNRSETFTGILYLLAAVVCFSCMDASAKWLGRSLGTWQIAGVRYFVSLVVVLAFMNPWKMPGILRTKAPWLQTARALCLVTTTLVTFVALRYLPLTQLTAIVFMAPLLTAVLAGPILGERIGPRRVVAVCVGFCGILMVTRPFGAGLKPATFLVVLVAVVTSFYSLLTRKLAQRDRAETTMLYTSIIGTVLVSPVLPFVWQAPASPLVWVVLLMLGVFGAVGHWLLILAHRHAASSALAPFYYAQIIGSGIFSIVIFGDLPDRWTVAGTAVVISSGLYLLYRERVRQAHPSSDVNG